MCHKHFEDHICCFDKQKTLQTLERVTQLRESNPPLSLLISLDPSFVLIVGCVPSLDVDVRGRGGEESQSRSLPAQEQDHPQVPAHEIPSREPHGPFILFCEPLSSRPPLLVTVRRLVSDSHNETPTGRKPRRCQRERQRQCRSRARQSFPLAPLLPPIGPHPHLLWIPLHVPFAASHSSLQRNRRHRRRSRR